MDLVLAPVAVAYTKTIAPIALCCGRGQVHSIAQLVAFVTSQRLGGLKELKATTYPTLKDGRDAATAAAGSLQAEAKAMALGARGSEAEVVVLVARIGGVCASRAAARAGLCGGDGSCCACTTAVLHLCDANLVASQQSSPMSARGRPEVGRQT